MMDAMPHDERSARRSAFRARCGLDRWNETLLAGDASFRKYWRLTDGTRSLVVMDAPPPHEDVRPFVRIGRHLAGFGLSTPAILEVEADDGFLLLEDLGDDTYARVLSRRLAPASGGDEASLYALAADVLATLHQAGDAALMTDLPRYLGQRMVKMATRLASWYLPMALGRPVREDERQAYRDAWSAVLPALESEPRTLVLRDYHIDNLMWLPDRPGVKACGLLDFQDAEIGCTAYDLVSLVEDARRDIDEKLRAATIQHYRQRMSGAVRGDFDAALAICAAQRHSRVIGTFARLKLRDGKGHYLRHLPRLWRLYDRALAHPALSPVREWVAFHLPPARRVYPEA
jgi:aminoglycoside/choline kinase family phosphotransferase